MDDTEKEAASGLANELAADQNNEQVDNNISIHDKTDISGSLDVNVTNYKRTLNNTHPKSLTRLQRSEAILASIDNGILTKHEGKLAYDLYPQQEGVDLTCAEFIDPEPIQWLWVNWLADNKFHILAGAPGTGKTTIALSFASTISSGAIWPDGTVCTPGNVVIWSGEDDIKDTIMPRLIADGANLRNIHFISGVNAQNEASRPFDPSKDMAALQQRIEEMGNVKLLIIDPVVSAVTGDSHKNSEVRRGLQPLVDLGAKLNVAILGITHFTKGTSGKDPLDRVTGSLAFGAVARIVLVTAKIQNDNGGAKHLFAKVKSNICIDEGGFYYGIKENLLSDYPGIVASVIKWGEKTEDSSTELLNTNDTSAEQLSMLDEAKQFLTSLLDDNTMSANEVFKLSGESGFTKTTINRAKKELGIKPKRNGYGSGSSWVWFLPMKVIKATEDDQTKLMHTFDRNENLRSELIRMYDGKAGAYLIEDILNHVEPDDYEQLLCQDVMTSLIETLIKSGKIKRKGDL